MKRSFAYASQGALHRAHEANIGGLFEKREQERDICERKHGGNPESVEAHKTIRGGVQAQREVVYGSIKLRGNTGTTVDEYAEHFGLNPNAISGRFSELARDGR